MLRNVFNWLRSIVLALCVIGAAGCSHCRPARAVGETLAPTLAEASAALVLRDSDGDIYPMCAAVWVSSTDLLTAAHCVTGAARRAAGADEDAPVPLLAGFQLQYINHSDVTAIYEEPKAIHTAAYVRIDDAHDLALLRAVGDPGSHAVATVSPDDPPVGSIIVVLGHPASMYWTQTQGYVTGYIPRIRVLGKQGPMLQIQAAVYKGNSGGGVYDAAGRLVGIVSFITPNPGVAVASAPSAVRAFLAAPSPSAPASPR